MVWWCGLSGVGFVGYAGWYNLVAEATVLLCAQAGQDDPYIPPWCAWQSSLDAGGQLAMRTTPCVATMARQASFRDSCCSRDLWPEGG